MSKETINVYAIYDKKAETHEMPVCLNNNAICIRQFSELVNDGKSMPSKYPEDFEIRYLGKFDTLTGKFEQTEIKTIISAQDVKQTAEKEK